MLYVSVHQLIKEHIQKGTHAGKTLMQSYQPKELHGAKNGNKDEFEFSAVHYDTATVIALIKDHIQNTRNTQ